jgi:hypothetical protein
MKKKKYKTKPFNKRQFYIAYSGFFVVSAVFGTFKQAIEAIELNYNTYRKQKPINGVYTFREGKYIVVCGYIGGNYKGGKFGASGEQDKLQSKWREDIEYDENI